MNFSCRPDTDIATKAAVFFLKTFLSPNNNTMMKNLHAFLKRFSFTLSHKLQLVPLPIMRRENATGRFFF
jgi:hypothetical protein